MRWMLVILALAATSGGAQTVAKQGEPPKQFRSPMIIETPLLVASVDSFRKEFSTQSKPEVREYICDNVSIASLSMKLKDGKNGMAELTLEVMLKNGYGHDKLVTIEFEVLNGEQRVATFRIDRFEAEEQRTSGPRVAKVVLPRAMLIKEPMTTLRITMTVVDD